MKRRLAALAQVLLGGGILAYIFLRLQRDGSLEKLRQALAGAAANWPLLAVAAALFGACLFFCTARWWLLLRAQALILPFRRAAALYLVGHFFNAFLFGATGGDLIKAYYVARETRHRRAEVVSTVFIDRIIGLLAQVLLALAVIVLRLPFFLRHPALRAALVFNLAVAGAAGLGLALVVSRSRFERWPLFRRLEQRTRLGQLLGRAHAAFDGCLRNRALVFQVLALSLLNHLGGIGMALYLGLALGLPLGFVDYLTVLPTINAVACIPITPSGLGTRESAAIYIFGALGVGAAAAVLLSLLLYATVLLWSLAGGLAYVAFLWLDERAAPQLDAT